MARPLHILRPVKVHIAVPEDLKAKIDLHLWSNVEGKIPHGVMSGFFVDLARKFFNRGETTSPHQVAETVDPTATHSMAMLGLLSEIALTDLRTGWTPETVLSFVKRARTLTGKVPV